MQLKRLGVQRVPCLVTKRELGQVEGSKVRQMKACTSQHFSKLKYLSVESVPSNLSCWLTGHRQLCSCYTAMVQEGYSQLVGSIHNNMAFSFLEFHNLLALNYKP